MPTREAVADFLNLAAAFCCASVGGFFHLSDMTSNDFRRIPQHLAAQLGPEGHLSIGRECHRYSSVTCPNRRSRCLSLNLPISKSVVRLNATEPAWPNTFHSPCARCIAAAGLGQSMGSPAAIPLSTKSKGNATKKVISATATLPIEHLNPGLIGPYRVHNSQV